MPAYRSQRRREDPPSEKRACAPVYGLRPSTVAWDSRDEALVVPRQVPMTPPGDASQPARVLIKEKIGESGVQLLRDAGFDLELGVDWSEEDLERRIGEFDGILIRSGTKLDAELIKRAERLRAVGRAGVGVDNVDVEAATQQGVVVANAPQSNVITAAEHTMALLLALARNAPQAHAALTGGVRERSRLSGVA